MASIEANSAIEADTEFGEADAMDVGSPDTLPVPVVPYLARTRYSDQLSRPDPSFVTHLMAIEQQCPQTRVLRRAQPAEAMAAYRSVAHHSHVGSAGGRMRRSS
jgi:hypothetical protein